jgi:hypothetical protein
MKMKHYHETQNDRWYEHYLNSEKLLSEVETALYQIEVIALDHIKDPAVRREITEITASVWRTPRPKE